MLVFADMNGQREKVFVGMSGGVDSSVSAALLQKEGYDVSGVFIKVWQADFLPCTWREERREAMRACAHLGIPFLTLDLETEYKEGVVDYMIREYGNGRTPNPDVMCNKHVKFGAFLDFAKKHGADFIATGHYARIQSSSYSLLPTPYSLLAGVDKEKDQSYFLWTLTQDQLAHTLFPVGGLEKSEVRKLAREFGLPNAEKKDSQGLCFMGPVDVKSFLAHYVAHEEGSVLSPDGAVIGVHDGALFYTIGQRHGFRVHHTTPQSGALYVISKNMAANTITAGGVAHTVQGESQATIEVVDSNLSPLLFESSPTQRCFVRTRYRGELHEVDITLCPNKNVQMKFLGEHEPVSEGQSAVFYLGEICLGGGVMTNLKSGVLQ